MKFRALYLIALLSVLLIACGTDDEPTDDAGGDTPPVAMRDSVSSNVESNDKIILFLGNSLSAGLGVDSDAAFPSLIQQKIDSLGWDFRVVNAGVSGETSSGGLGRIEWVLREKVDVLVLELGGNDGLRGISADVTKRNLQEIVSRTRGVYPDAEIVLAGMQIPPNLGAEYTAQFRDVFPELALRNDIHLIPFLLEGVGGVDSMMQDDGIHPNTAGHRKVAENVWEVLDPILSDMREPEV
jgi:acyl-CoA thioesterase-1